jgi:hypothetical protein
MSKLTQNVIAYGKTKKVNFLLVLVMLRLIKYSREYYKYKNRKRMRGWATGTLKFKPALIP